MKYWQVAAGEGARDYSEVFLRFGRMMIGGGNHGNYFDNEDHYRSLSWGAQVKRFAKYVVEEDRVILKRPHHRRKSEKEKWQIQAVGYVKGDYEYVEQFDDVEGWDLQHCRKVQWVCPTEKVLTNGLAMGTCKSVYKREAIEKAEKILEEGNQQVAEEIPSSAKKISDEDLVESLIAKGLRPADAETVIQTIWRAGMRGTGVI